jgi:DNA-binding response OmpR family regulator
MNGNILIIEDDETLRMTLEDRLRGEQYLVDVAKDAEEGIDKINASPFDLLIIDVMLPYHSGFELCRNVRNSGLATPIMFLTARTSSIDKVVGLQLGGDDYVTKPFEADELIARIEALLRRTSSSGRSVHQIGSLHIDVSRQAVTREGKPVSLTDREFHLLRYLIERAGQTVSRGELLRAVWGYDENTYSRTVDVHIFNLRRKLEVDPTQPELITTVSGIGYKLVRRSQ